MSAEHDRPGAMPQNIRRAARRPVAPSPEVHMLWVEYADVIRAILLRERMARTPEDEQ